MRAIRFRSLSAKSRLLSVCRSTVCAAGLLLAAMAQAQQASTTPPAGMVTGAWGQSQHQYRAATATLSTQEKGYEKIADKTPASQLLASAQAALIGSNPGTSSLSAATPAATAAVRTALPTLGAATDPVSKFLQERGLLPQAQGEPSRMMEQVRDAASGLVVSAMNFLGVRYTRGGNSVESGFDCSGFTRHIFEMSVGMVLPHRADEQARMSNLLTVKREELKPGDLVFFNTMKRTFSHVGIYVGEGKFIHSPRVGGAVRVEDMREAYWAKRFTGARRADLNASVDSPKAQR